MGAQYLNSGFSVRHRDATRAVAMNSEDSVGIFYDGKYESMKLLGGGIEPVDKTSDFAATLENCVQREIVEESGRPIFSNRLVGVVEQSYLQTPSDSVTEIFRQTDFCFVARVGHQQTSLGLQERRRGSYTDFLEPQMAYEAVRDQDVEGDHIAVGNRMRDLRLLEHVFSRRDLTGGYADGASTRSVQLHEHHGLPTTQVWSSFFDRQYGSWSED